MPRSAGLRSGAIATWLGRSSSTISRGPCAAPDEHCKLACHVRLGEPCRANCAAVGARTGRGLAQARLSGRRAAARGVLKKKLAEHVRARRTIRRSRYAGLTRAGQRKNFALLLEAKSALTVATEGKIFAPNVFNHVQRKKATAFATAFFLGSGADQVAMFDVTGLAVTSKRSASITFTQAFTKSLTNFSSLPFSA